MSHQVENLLHLAQEAGLPEEFMHYLIDSQGIRCLNDLREITPDDMIDMKEEYLKSIQATPDQTNLWVSLVTRKLRSLIKWINSFHRVNGRAPQWEEMTSDNLEILPEEKEGLPEIPDTPGVYARYTMTPVRNTSYVTSRRSYGSAVTTDSQQAVKRRNVKVSITEYPKFTGKAKDWIVFERKFRSVASSHNLDRVLQDEEYEPIDSVDGAQYKEDLEFIYDAFQNAWADSMNF